MESGNRENWGGRQGSVNEEEEEDYPMEPTGQRRGETQWKRRVWNTPYLLSTASPHPLEKGKFESKEKGHMCHLALNASVHENHETLLEYSIA